MFSLIHTECLLGACWGIGWEGRKREIIILPEMEPESKKGDQKRLSGVGTERKQGHIF